MHPKSGLPGKSLSILLCISATCQGPADLALSLMPPGEIHMKLIKCKAIFKTRSGRPTEEDVQLLLDSWAVGYTAFGKCYQRSEGKNIPNGMESTEA